MAVCLALLFQVDVPVMEPQNIDDYGVSISHTWFTSPIYLMIIILHWNIQSLKKRHLFTFTITSRGRLEGGECLFGLLSKFFDLLWWCKSPQQGLFSGKLLAIGCDDDAAFVKLLWTLVICEKSFFNEFNYYAHRLIYSSCGSDNIGRPTWRLMYFTYCLLYTSDAADE